MSKVLVTHRAPDLDAVTSIWIFKTFHANMFADAKVAFVNAGETLSQHLYEEYDVRAEDVVHVDTGLGTFDHHQPERGMIRTCASKLVYDFLSRENIHLREDWALQQIVEYVTVDDHFEDYFWPESSTERPLFSLRGILHGLEFSGLHNDESQLAFAMKCLDGVYASLKLRKKATDDIAEKGRVIETIYGKTLFIESSNQMVLRVGQLLGNPLVIVRDPKQGHLRIKLAPVKGWTLRPVYARILAQDAVGQWYFHPGEHMLLNGSRKAQHKPSPLSLDQIEKILKSVRADEANPSMKN
ncbi:MAG: hypothetical protein UX04_C0007G0013 [Microgenomates group bacterium GW2011_GWF2_45_18]|nr:MAG: hypothetical protein UW18_C0002G0108 [Microgenomates group bacterium GW2011_GWF1_44_10]KKU01424.1 MAG: hypothetical protein UX04_C0007G0013 [Microgenomates group bacterium GW2011_GWF2_45_18]OGJ41501.1 MAG: hypothetical protein A2378_00455 [Candidatus Pacebacteria bacterium RIFOXYB1_FULL_44_10]HAU98860.1 hypothetical protein [Candidatus Paceibacterota bacterium]HAX01182.1 hypothetical protein [Candidatus Paceibacterota bacterium]